MLAAVETNTNCDKKRLNEFKKVVTNKKENSFSLFIYNPFENKCEEYTPKLKIFNPNLKIRALNVRSKDQKVLSNISKKIPHLPKRKQIITRQEDIIDFSSPIYEDINVTKNSKSELMKEYLKNKLHSCFLFQRIVLENESCNSIIEPLSSN